MLWGNKFTINMMSRRRFILSLNVQIAYTPLRESEQRRLLRPPAVLSIYDSTLKKCWVLNQSQVNCHSSTKNVLYDLQKNQWFRKSFIKAGGYTQSRIYGSWLTILMEALIKVMICSNKRAKHGLMNHSKRLRQVVFPLWFNTG